MALRLGALHDALLHPGDAELAKQAAEEVADYQRQIAGVRSDLALIKWMLGIVTTLAIGNLWLSFGILSRLPR